MGRPFSLVEGRLTLKDMRCDCYRWLLARYRAELAEPAIGSATFGGAIGGGTNLILNVREERHLY